MTIQDWKSHFAHRADAIAELEAAGMFWQEIDLTGFERDLTPHAHDYATWLYILGGVFKLHEPDTGLIHRCASGDKIHIPRGARHFGVHGGYQALVGLTVDPTTLTPAGAYAARTDPASA